jgi:hypothetical protein
MYRFDFVNTESNICVASIFGNNKVEALKKWKEALFLESPISVEKYDVYVTEIIQNVNWNTANA